MFPKDWPHDCPEKSGAAPASGVVFRVVKKNPLEEADFRTQFEKKPKQPPSHPVSCEACGLSVLTDEKELEHHHELFPWQGRYVARGSLEGSHGKMKLLGGEIRSHHNWWSFTDVKRVAIFSLHREFDK